MTDTLEIPKKEYYYKRKNCDIEQMLSYYNRGEIDTNLDCQRGLVWTDDQKQLLIDSLMFREIIPEFHVIKEEWESMNRFADGKQRITTILDFINNKLPWYQSKADDYFKPLFGDKTSIKFEDLPNEYQNMIKAYDLSLVIYNNMNAKSITKLFRKLNNGTKLSNFAKMLSENIILKKNFLDPLMEHPIINNLFSEKQIEKDDAEQTFLSILFLILEYNDTKEERALDLRPTDFNNLIPDLVKLSDEEAEEWSNKVNEIKNIILEKLDLLQSLDCNVKMRSRGPFVSLIYYSCIYNLPPKKIKDNYESIMNLSASQVIGPGADYSKNHVKKWMNTVKGMLI